MIIENKWKKFALYQTLSDWYEHVNLDDIYDDIMLEDEQGLAELFDEHELIVWEVFEDMPLIKLAEFIKQLAEHAQSVANDY